jgi:serine phosphatase RsbU (regulator of sigma subunit)
MVSDLPYSLTIRTLHPDDLLILSSDGIIEAYNHKCGLFGFDRLETAVAHLDAAQPAQVLHADLLKTVRAFTNGVEPYHDLTLLILKVKDSS